MARVARSLQKLLSQTLRRILVKKTLFVVALVALASVTLFAQNSQTYGVPTHVVSNVGNLGHRTAYQEPAGLKKIYSNLGTATDAFDWTNGWLIAGPSSPLGHEQFIGYSFVPTKAHVATQIRAAAFYFSSGGGGNDFNFGIWSDSSGVPGKEIKGKDKKNLPTWTGQQTDCCKTQNVTIKATKLAKGKTYWVVLTNAASVPNAEGAWDFVYNDAPGTQAYNLGSGWATEQVQVSAFAVYGTS
jgi:hypothetical protein